MGWWRAFAGIPAVGRARGGRTAGAFLGALLLLAGCEARPNWVQPAAGEVLSGEELLLRMRWLAQPGRLADPASVLRVTGGRFAPSSPRSEALGIYFSETTILPTRDASGVIYMIPNSMSTGPTRNRYSLSVHLDESQVCITPADMLRVLGSYDDVGPPPIGVRGPMRMEHSLTSSIYRHSAEGQPFAGLSVTFMFQRCASQVAVSQAASDQPESPR